MEPEAKKALIDMMVNMDDYCSSLKETNEIMKNMNQSNLKLTKDIELVTSSWKFIKFFLQKEVLNPEEK